MSVALLSARRRRHRGLPQTWSGLASPNVQELPAFRPGTTHGYSNANYVFLGLIVEKVTGRALNLVVRDRIFRPLGLDDTSYVSAVPWAQNTFGWPHAKATAEEMYCL